MDIPAWGGDAIGRELAAARTALRQALESLATTADPAAAGLRGEVAQLAEPAATAATLARQPTSTAALTILTRLLDDLGATARAMLHAGLTSPLLDTRVPGLDRARFRFVQARIHVDHARRAIAATLAAIGRAG